MLVCVLVLLGVVELRSRTCEGILNLRHLVEMARIRHTKAPHAMSMPPFLEVSLKGPVIYQKAK